MNTNVDENVNSFVVNGQNTQNVRSVYKAETIIQCQKVISLSMTAMVVLCCRSKQVSQPLSSHTSTDLDEIWQRSCGFSLTRLGTWSAPDKATSTAIFVVPKRAVVPVL